MEVEDLKIKLESFLREAENIREGRDAEVKKVKSSGGYIKINVSLSRRPNTTGVDLAVLRCYLELNKIPDGERDRKRQKDRRG